MKWSGLGPSQYLRFDGEHEAVMRDSGGFERQRFSLASGSKRDLQESGAMDQSVHFSSAFKLKTAIAQNEVS